MVEAVEVVDAALEFSAVVDALLDDDTELSLAVDAEVAEALAGSIDEGSTPVESATCSEPVALETGVASKLGSSPSTT